MIPRLLAPLLLLATGCGLLPGLDRRDPDATSAPVGPGALNVGIVLVEGFGDSEVTAPLDVFHHASYHVQPGFRVFTVGRSADPVHSFEGLTVLPDFGFDDAPRIDVLVVPGSQHAAAGDLADAELRAFLATRGAGARWIIGLRDGVFLLAGSGLLDGLQCTTFPPDVARLRSTFPRLDVRSDASFVHDGRVVTAVGGALSFDPGLYLVERLYGRPAAQRVGTGLVLLWDPERIRFVVGPRAEVSAQPAPR